MRHFIVLVFTFFMVVSIFSQESAVEASAENGADWLETYYQNPTPEKFVPQMKAWALNGTLRNEAAEPALSGFVSQVLRQNRDKIEGWVRVLRVGDPKDFVVLDNALYFSRTTEADRIIEASLGRKIKAEERPSKILKRPLDEPPAMNMVWGYYYATGSENAIRRVINGFRYVDAPLAPEGETVPEGYEPYYVKLPEIAASSLLRNMKKYPDVVAICEKIYAKDSSLTEMEKVNVYHLLSIVNPAKFPPEEKGE